MARRRKGMMSEELKRELAKDLGFYDTVEKEGWGGIRAKDAGNMVKRALEIAEKTLAQQAQAQQALQVQAQQRPLIQQQLNPQQQLGGRPAEPQSAGWQRATVQQPASTQQPPSAMPLASAWQPAAATRQRSAAWEPAPQQLVQQAAIWQMSQPAEQAMGRRP